MDDNNTAPISLNWSSTDDLVHLLDWIKQQPEGETIRELPASAYGIDLNDTQLRAMGGLLAVQRAMNHTEHSRDLIRKLLSKRELSGEHLRLLLEQLEQLEAVRREESTEKLKAVQSGVSAPLPPAPDYPTQPHIETFSEGRDHSGLFAIEVHAVQAARLPVSVVSDCADLLLAMHHASDQSQHRYGLGTVTRIAWRYISAGRKITLALLVRVSGLDSPEQATQAALDLWHTVDGLLPLNRRYYAYRPVISAERLQWLRQPAEFQSAFAITRQQHTFDFEGKTIYYVHPVGGRDGNLHALLAEMMRTPGVSVLDIQVTAARWDKSEQDRINEMLRAGGPDVNIHQTDDIEMMLRRLNDHRYRRALEIYNQLLSRNLLFEVHVRVACSENVAPTALPMVAALNLFDTSLYEIRPATMVVARREISTAIRNITPGGWPRSHAPAGLDRLLHLWTPDETLAAARLPTPGPGGIPGITVQKTKITSLPDNLPVDGLLVGDAFDPTLNQMEPVYVNQADRARHIYIVGRTGTGKTTLLENMALQDIRAGRGVGVVDPHGDLIEAILARIPPERAQDVVLFDPSAAERPIGLNILDVEGDFEKNMVIGEFIGLMYAIYDPGRTGIVGPRFEQAVRNAMHIAMAVRGSTLIDVMRILSNRTYARACVQFVTDPMVQAYWKDIAEAQSDFHRSEVLDYITSKFGRFTGDTTIRNIIGQSRTTMDFNRIMDERKILLVNLSKGKIGPENSRFLGLLLVPRLLIAAFSRARQPAHERSPFYLYVDEFHNFATPMFSTMLSEGRKYGLSLTMANQFISQLTDDVREAVFGNVGTMGVFQVGVKDAHLLEQELYPVFNVDDLVNLPSFHMALKMPLDGVSGRPFVLKTRPSSTVAVPALAEAIRDYTLLHYGRDTIAIDAEVRYRFEQPPQPRR